MYSNNIFILNPSIDKGKNIIDVEHNSEEKKKEKNN
jgi:hypothetical protein